MKMNMNMNMKILRFFILLSLGFPVLSLMPKKLPNGGARGFVPNLENPREDLKAISAGTALLISKNWMQNILLDVMVRRRSKDLSPSGEFVYDDLHIVSCIQELQKDIEESQKKLFTSWVDTLNINDNAKPIIYFAWKPKSLQGFNEVLFLVVAILVKEPCEPDSDEQCFYLDVKNVIQSPFWDEKEINSIYLKRSLIDQNNFTNETILRFDKLYETNLRYRLAWETWFQDGMRD